MFITSLGGRPGGDARLGSRARRQGGGEPDGVAERFLLASVLAVFVLYGLVEAQEDPRETADKLNRRVVRLYKEGKVNEATEAARTAVELARTKLGPDDLRYADSLNNLASLYKSLGRLAEAEPLFKQALEITRKALGENHPDYADNLNNLALLYKSMGRYAEAEPLYEKAMEKWRAMRGEEHPDYAVILNNLAGLYSSMGDYAEAERFYRKAIEIKQEALGEEHPSYATSLSNLAELYRFTGRYAEAEPFYRKSLAIRQKALGEGHPDYAMSLNSLAVLYECMGRYAEAEELYKRAAEAWPLMLGENHPDYAAILHNQASFYQSMDRRAEAEPLFKRALEIRREALGEEHPDYVMTLNNLAGLYNSMGRYAEAEPLCRRALEITRANAGEDDPDFAVSLYNLATLYAVNRRPQEALQLALRAFEVEVDTLNRMLSVASEKQKTQFLRAIWPTVQMIYSLASVHLPDDPSALRAGLWTLLRAKAIRLEGMMGEHGALLRSSDPQVAEKVEELKRACERFAFLRFGRPQGMSLSARRDEIATLKKDQKKLEAELANLSEEFRLAQRVRNATIDAVRSSLPDGAILLSFCRTPLFNFQTRSQLPPHYLVYVLDKTRDLPILIDLGEANVIDEAVGAFRTAAQDPESDLGGPSRQLRGLVFAQIEEHIPQGAHLLISPAGQLNLVPFEALCQENDYPLRKYKISYLDMGRDLLRFAESADSSKEMVLVCDPDYDLPADARAQMSKRIVKPAELALLRDAQRSSDLQGIRFERLPATREEGVVVSRILKAEGGLVRICQGSAASEEALKCVKGPCVLHIATRGFFFEDRFGDAQANPSPPRETSGGGTGVPEEGLLRTVLAENPLLRSGLAFAGANCPTEAGSGVDDGIATSLELSRLDLRNTEMVVLSACDTGGGKGKVGEGVFALRRALQHAGARSIIMSLWKTDDRASKLLMARFYGNWVSGMSKMDAIQQAKEWLMNYEQKEDAASGGGGASRKPYTHPYYWAPFVLTGDWQ